MKDQIQAIEAAIRKANPELMELSFGCGVTPKHGNGSVAKVIKVYEDNTFDGLLEVQTEDATGVVTITGAKLENVDIIGHPIHLEHLLRALCVANTANNEVRDYITRVYGGTKSPSIMQIDMLGYRNTKVAYYDLSASFRENLENEELREWLYKILCEKV